MKIQTSKLPGLETTIFSVMSALAIKHKAINLSQGYPDFMGDEYLFELVNQAMKSGKNQYAPMPGTKGLRRAISEKFDRLYSSSYHPETEITVTAGATQAIFTAVTSVINKGDEVIVFHPAYDCYVPTVQLNGGVVIPIQLQKPDYKIDWKAVSDRITPRTKMIMINSPHNPSGTVLDESDMHALQDLTEGTDIMVLSDEVYEHIIFDGLAHQSVCLFPGLKSRSFITASFGKIFHNTGWKMGYCCAPQALMDEFKKVHQFNVFSVNHPVQHALEAYLQEPSHYLELSEFYQEKRDKFLSLIAGSRFKLIPSEGTYFQAADFSEISSESAVDFSRRITIDHGVASIPISAFNHKKMDDQTIRFCFAKKDDTLERAAEILVKL